MFAISIGVISMVVCLMTIGIGVAFLCTVRGLGTLDVSKSADEQPELTVVVPARDEQQDLQMSIESLLAQQEVDLRVVIVNDHSRDRTGEIADKLAATDSRVSVIHHPPLNDGWFGKTNAMQQGAAIAASQLLVFCDADVMHHPRCFISAWQEMKRTSVDLLSLCPLWICESFWENALLPHCMIAGTVQFMPPSVNDPKSPHAAAAGAFIMIDRHTFASIDGFESVKQEMLDDVEFARSVKRHGHSVRFMLAPRLLQVRLFKSNRGAFWGLTKNVLGSVNSKWMAVPAMLLPIIFYWVPLLSILVGAWQNRPALILAGIAANVAHIWATWLSMRICEIRWKKAIFYPAAALPIACCYSTALYHWWTDGAVSWRGRVLPVKPQQTG